MSAPGPQRPRVVLVGPMGAGKTTVGELLATRWQVAVRDTDRDIETMTGRAIAEIFVDEGEARFREREREAVAAALAEHTGVLALGGGAVLDPTTFRLLESQRVVFLSVGFADAVKRVGLGTGRPLLLGNVRAQVKALLDERYPVYDRVAAATVPTDGMTPEAVAARVATLVEDLERQETP